ncbi:MAG: YidC/Oxa1 family membrane protein insertase [Patescibacteria group bacterium]
MIAIFNEIFYRPLFNALILLYDYFSFSDFGIAIIILTILIRLILLPLFYKSAKDQSIIQRLAPKMKEIQESHKNDKAKQAKAMMDLYKEHKVNPFSGFLSLILIQLPIIFALYQVFLKGLNTESFIVLYNFVPTPQEINHYFLGLIDLSKRNAVIVVLAAIAQYFQGKLSLSKNKKPIKDMTMAEQMSRQMVFIGPGMTLVFLFYLSSAIGLYWLTSSVFSVIQQIVINKQLNVGEEKLVEIDKKLHEKK